MNIRLDGEFLLLSPLSHIGEVQSTTAFLVQEPILQPDGSLAEVFCYSGNAWRGQLRDLAASYMLERLGSPTLSLDSFHLLFSGGRIGGAQVVDLERARAMRRTIPMIAVWGGGVGNQILPGKMRVGNCYPLCREAMPILPSRLHERAGRTPYAGMTFEKSYSRKDDAKDDRLAGALPPPERQLLEAPAKKQKPHDEAAQQMRMTVELVAAGACLHSRIDLIDASEVEVGALVSALHAFSRSPHIGGQGARGHGRAALEYAMIDLDTGETRPFVTIDDGGLPLLSPDASRAKDAYDAHLRGIYDAMLGERKAEIAGLIGAA